MTAPKLTPAEALAMFKDWEDSALTIYDFRHKWYVSNDPDSFALIAIAALETLLSEHEATKAKLAALQASVGMDTNGPAAPDSLPSPETRPPSDRMCGSREHQEPLYIPPEIRHLGPLVAAQLMGSAEPAAAVPSDEEISEQLMILGRLDDSECSPSLFRMLRLLAKRIGVKL